MTAWTLIEVIALACCRPRILIFYPDVRPSLNNELSSRTDFIEELNLLSDKLEQENEAMLIILKQKMAEAKNAQIDAAKVSTTSPIIKRKRR